MKLDWLADDLKAIVPAFTDPQIVSLILYGEVRSEPVQGIVAVGAVIRNRVRKPGWWGESFKGVCLQSWQFSCLHEKGGAANYKRVLAFAQKLAAGTQITHERERQCVWVAHGVVGDYVIDNTKGSTHYHTATLTPRPEWTKGQTPSIQIGAHVFYNTVK